MGRYLTKTVSLVLTPILLLHFLIPSSYGASFNSSENGVCISKGESPKSGDLNLCSSKVFDGNPCCSASQIQTVSLAVENLATYGEASKDCLELFVGIQSQQPLGVCASFCDRVFEACSDAYFSSIAYFDNNSNVTKHVIVPCGENEDIICGKASKWESNGTAFCDAAGFTVDSEEEPCYGRKASLEAVMESESSEDKKSEKVKLFEVVDLQQLITTVQSVSLSVTMVLYRQFVIAMIRGHVRRNMIGNA